MSRSIVVVGAGLAGLRAAEQLRGRGERADHRRRHGGPPPYNRPPLTKAALKGGSTPPRSRSDAGRRPRTSSGDSARR